MRTSQRGVPTGRDGALRQVPVRKDRAPPARNVAHARMRRCESRCGDVLTRSVPPAATRAGKSQRDVPTGRDGALRQVPVRKDRAPPARNVAHARMRRCESRCGDVFTRSVPPAGTRAGTSQRDVPTGRDGALRQVPVRKDRAPPARNVAHARMRRCESRCGDVLTRSVPPAAAHSSVIHDGASIFEGRRRPRYFAAAPTALNVCPRA
jgi:hypothetical protein